MKVVVYNRGYKDTENVKECNEFSRVGKIFTGVSTGPPDVFFRLRSGVFPRGFSAKAPARPWAVPRRLMRRMSKRRSMYGGARRCADPLPRHAPRPPSRSCGQN